MSTKIMVDGDSITTNSSSGQENYSINEQVIGTWKDGRPVYQITYGKTTSLKANALTTTNFSSFNEKIILIEYSGYVSILDDTYTVYPIPHNYPAGLADTLDEVYFSIDLKYVSTSNTYNVRLHYQYPAASTVSIFITIKYLKDSDL